MSDLKTMSEYEESVSIASQMASRWDTLSKISLWLMYSSLTWFIVALGLQLFDSSKPSQQLAYTLAAVSFLVSRVVKYFENQAWVKHKQEMESQITFLKSLGPWEN